MGVPLGEGRQQRWKELLAGYGTAGQKQLAADWDFVASDFSACLPVKVQYTLGVFVEPLASFSEQNSAAVTLEQGLVERFFERLNTLADRRLRQTKCLRRSGETVQLSGF
jgi:hypothetical protein